MDAYLHVPPKIYRAVFSVCGDTIGKACIHRVYLHINNEHFGGCDVCILLIMAVFRAVTNILQKYCESVAWRYSD